MFTPAATPVFELLIVISLRASAAGTGGAYFSCRILIELFPVLIVPAGANGHNFLPFLYVQFYYITVLQDMVSLYHYTVVLA